jgi:hypothetical protein
MHGNVETPLTPDVLMSTTALSTEAKVPLVTAFDAMRRDQVLALWGPSSNVIIEEFCYDEPQDAFAELTDNDPDLMAQAIAGVGIEVRMSGSRLIFIRYQDVEDIDHDREVSDRLRALTDEVFGLPSTIKFRGDHFKVTVTPVGDHMKFKETGDWLRLLHRLKKIEEETGQRARPKAPPGYVVQMSQRTTDAMRLAVASSELTNVERVMTFNTETLELECHILHKTGQEAA